MAALLVIMGEREEGERTACELMEPLQSFKTTNQSTTTQTVNTEKSIGKTPNGISQPYRSHAEIYN